MASAREEKKAAPASTPDYFPIFPDCWETSRLPLPENHTIMAALVLPETNEVIAAVKSKTTDKDKTIETLFFMRHNLSDKDSMKLTRLHSENAKNITRCAISRNYLAAVIDNTTINVWDFNAHLVDTLESQSKNLAIAFLEINRLVCSDNSTYMIRNVDEMKSSHESPHQANADFHKLVVTQNKYIVIVDSSNTFFFLPEKKPSLCGAIRGQFLCETATEFVVTQYQQQNIYFNRYDKVTLMRNKDIRVPMFEQGRHIEPVATALPMGWLNLITTHRTPGNEAKPLSSIDRHNRFNRYSTILNQAFEPMAQKLLCPVNLISPSSTDPTFNASDLVNTQSTIPVFITSNGNTLGNPRNYCLRWDKDPLHTQRQKPADIVKLLKSFLFDNVPSIVLEYCPLSYCSSPEQENQLTYQSISKDALKQFTLFLKEQLNNAADFASTKAAAPTLHKPLDTFSTLKNKLLAELNSVLEKLAHSEDTAAIEQQMIASLNHFWKELSQNKAIKSSYLDAFNILMGENRFNTPEKAEKLNITKLRYLVLERREKPPEAKII